MVHRLPEDLAFLRVLQGLAHPLVLANPIDPVVLEDLVDQGDHVYLDCLFHLSDLVDLPHLAYRQVQVFHQGLVFLPSLLGRVVLSGLQDLTFRSDHFYR